MKATGWAISILCLSAINAFAQPIPDLDQGTQVFRVILHRLGLEPITSIDDALENPQSTVIVLHGRTDGIKHRFDNLRLFTFIKQGGAVLVDSDHFNGHFLENEIGVRTAGPTLVYAGPVEQRIYRESLRQCPLLLSPMRSIDHDLLNKLKNVATNNPSFLRETHTSNDRLISRETFAESPRLCRALSEQIEERQVYDYRLPIAQTGIIGNGRFVAIADHSIFINSMLLQVDNDNIAFTHNIVNWLSENGKRHRVLFVDDGQIRGEFDINLDYWDPPIPHPDVLVPLMNKLIVGLERDDFFNQTLMRLIPQHRILRGMLLGLTVFVAAVALYRVTAGKWRREAQAHRLPDQVDSLAIDNTLNLNAAQPTPLELGAAARELAYGTLHDLVNDDMDQAPVVHTANPLARGTWTRRVKTYWQIASGRTGRTMTPANLKSLARRLEQLRRAVERGDIHLSRPEELA